MAGAVVKIDVKNIPATKLPTTSSSLVFVSTFTRKLVLARNIANEMLTAMTKISFNIKLLSC